MTGGPRKLVWNRPGTIGHNITGKPGSAIGDYRDALTVEDAVRSAHRIKVRSHREKQAIAAENRTAAERAKITLSSPEWIAKFMKDD